MVDGFAATARRVVIRVGSSFGFSVFKLQMKDYLFHFNWGWRGVNDGYYSYLAFKRSDMAFKDEEFDTGGDSFINNDYSTNVLYLSYY